jgi:PTS system trehalose-specific IIC component
MANGIGVGGLPAILSVKTQYWSVFGTAMIVAIAVPLMLTMAIYKRKHAAGKLLVV